MPPSASSQQNSSKSFSLNGILASLGSARIDQVRQVPYAPLLHSHRTILSGVGGRAYTPDKTRRALHLLRRRYA